MNRIRTALVLAVMASLAIAGVASAHRAITYDCETVTLIDAKAGWTFDLYSNTFEGNYHFAITHDGQSTFGPIRPGGYGYQFTDTKGHGRENGSLVVTQCATPSPSVTPSPTPTPTPSATPTATPSASPTPTPSQPTPTRTPSSERTPAPTLPPTSTADPTPPSDSGSLPLFGVLLLVVVFVTTFVVTGKRR